MAREVPQRRQRLGRRLARSVARAPLRDVRPLGCEELTPFVTNPVEGAPGEVVANSDVARVEHVGRQIRARVGIDFGRAA